MTYILAIFRSRSQAIDCNIKLKTAGIAAELINTPKEAKVGCGLSLKLLPTQIEKAKAIVRRNNYSAFYGFYILQNKYGAIQISRWS